MSLTITTSRHIWRVLSLQLYNIKGNFGLSEEDLIFKYLRPTWLCADADRFCNGSENRTDCRRWRCSRSSEGPRTGSLRYFRPKADHFSSTPFSLSSPSTFSPFWPLFWPQGLWPIAVRRFEWPLLRATSQVRWMPSQSFPLFFVDSILRFRSICWFDLRRRRRSRSDLGWFSLAADLSHRIVRLTLSEKIDDQVTSNSLI